MQYKNIIPHSELGLYDARGELIETCEVWDIHLPLHNTLSILINITTEKDRSETKKLRQKWELTG